MKMTSLFICAVLCLCCRTKRQESATRADNPPADPPAAAAQSNRPMNLHEDDLHWLSGNAALVFIGSLEKKESSKDPNGMIITSNTFRIEKVVKGAHDGATATYTTLGGTSGTETMDVSHMPVFEPGVKYLVFISSAPARYAPVLNHDKGVFLVQGEKVFSYAGSIIRDVADGKILYGNQSYPRAGREMGREPGQGNISNEVGVKTQRAADTENEYYPLSKLTAQIH
ncbi:hypothetical protein V9K67_14585 [Paraflavisolibacter sp. H34]|uniref:hypothetical protein n=1 Tax=Huijunlia imazamoxiresistens TaxID=3127457 RepID=UPI003018A22D